MTLNNIVITMYYYYYIVGITSIVSVTQKAAGNPGILLKGQHTNSHSQVLTLGSQEGMVAWGETEPYGFRAKVWGTAANVPGLSCPLQ